MQRNIPAVDLIVLDVHRRHKDFKYYDRLPVAQKIERICELIHAEMRLLAHKKQSMKLFVMREHAITNRLSLFCDNDARVILKEKFLQLTQQYPDICIIPGTISTKKHYSALTVENYNMLEQAYMHPFLQSMIQRENNSQETVTTTHKEKKSSLVSSHLKQLHQLDKTKGFDVQRNSMYVFFGKSKDRRDKLVPYNETMDARSKASPANVVYRPFKKNVKSPVITFIHPYTGQSIVIGFEICIEHCVGYLKSELRDKTVDLQIIISDSATVTPWNICADYVLHADSMRGCRFIASPDANKLDVHFYHVDVLDYDSVLIEPSPVELHYLADLKIDILNYVKHIVNITTRDDDFVQMIHKRYANLLIGLQVVDQIYTNDRNFPTILEAYHRLLTKDFEEYAEELRKETEQLTQDSVMNIERSQSLTLICMDLNTMIQEMGYYIALLNKREMSLYNMK